MLRQKQEKKRMWDSGTPCEKAIPGRPLLRKLDVQQLEDVWAGAKGVFFQAKEPPYTCEAAV